MERELVELTSRLVAIDSVNPDLVAGGAGEAEAAAFVAGWADAEGLAAELLEDTRGRPSVLVRSGASRDGPTLLLCGHLDTVGVDGMADPHEPRVEGDRLHGRGAYDMKAGVAAALLACREAARLGLAGTVVVAAVADEEHASLGVQDALRSVSADAAVVTEPTELEVAIAHRGFAWLEIEVDGRAAHGSRPHLGMDAIVKAGPVLTALGRLDEALGEKPHPLVGRGSVHASTIGGGSELSTYPDRCTIGLERRTLPGEAAAAVEGEIATLLEECRREDPELSARSRTLLVRDPFEIGADEPIVAAVREASAEVLGSPAPLSGASYWADSAFIAAAGIPTVLFGPSGEGAHAVEEWVSIPDTIAVTRTLVGVARRVCGSNQAGS